MVSVAGARVRVGSNGGGKISQHQTMKHLLDQAEHFDLRSNRWHTQPSFIDREITPLDTPKRIDNIKQKQDG